MGIILLLHDGLPYGSTEGMAVVIVASYQGVSDTT